MTVTATLETELKDTPRSPIDDHEVVCSLLKQQMQNVLVCSVNMGTEQNVLCYAKEQNKQQQKRVMGPYHMH